MHLEVNVQDLSQEVYNPRNKKLSFASIKNWIFVKMGADYLGLELPDVAIHQFIEESIDQYNFYRPMRRYAVLPLSSGKNVYKLDPEQYGLGIESGFLFNPEFADNSDYRLLFGPAGIIYNTWAAANNWVGIDSLAWMEAYRMFIRQIKRVTSSDFKFELDTETGILSIQNGGNGIFAYTYFEERDLSQIPKPHHLWFKEFCLACAKEYIGRIRSKYGTIPGIQGDIQLNGDAILQEGRDKKDALREELQAQIDDIPPIWD